MDWEDPAIRSHNSAERDEAGSVEEKNVGIVIPSFNSPFQEDKMAEFKDHLSSFTSDYSSNSMDYRTNIWDHAFDWCMNKFMKINPRVSKIHLQIYDI